MSAALSFDACSGEMIETDEWGFRELAYRIKGERRGFYVRLDYAAGAAVMNEVMLAPL